MNNYTHKINPDTAKIMQELNIIDRYQEEVLSNEKRRSRFAFSWVNMANQSLPIATLFEMIRMNPYLMPPRTGHIGNWNDIIDGYIGQRNDNTVICKEQKLGYPLIFDLTQTEDELLQKGDLTYLPGSIVEKGKRRKLSLFTWDGAQFVERTRENPLFVPFVLTSKETKLLLDSPKTLYAAIQQQVKIWASQGQPILSASFVSRFTEKPTVLAINEVPVKTKSVEPKGFSQLTFQQASMLVGALFNFFSY